MESLLDALESGWWFTFLYIVTGTWAITHVLRQRKEPMAMLAWIFWIFIVPVVGAVLYFLLGEPRVQRRARKKRRRGAYIVRAIASRTKDPAVRKTTEPAGSPAFSDLSPELQQLARTSTKLGNFSLIPGNEVELLTSSQQVYEKLLASIRQARHHVHLEYYIFRPDATGCMFRDCLIERAREGVEIRLLLDGVGAWGTGGRFLRPLKEAGAQVRIFLPAVPLRRRWHINCRNHRKIVVVDGETAYTGSQNIGDEYRGYRSRHMPWRDTHLSIKGPAAQQLQEVFVEDWYFAAREDLAAPTYLRPMEQRGNSLVQIVSSGPDQEREVLIHIVFSALSLARRNIRISTPYFVPERGLILALQNAAYRGVKVEILIPARTDNHISLWAGRSYYQELLHAGVHIYEFDHAMLHSKTITIDHAWSMVGSANMDSRSFFLNFEVTATIFDERISCELNKEFESYLSGSRTIERQDGSAPLWPGILEGAARLFSPVL